MFFQYDQGIDDLCLKYFVEAGAMAVRRVTKDDLSNIARATGGVLAVVEPSCLIFAATIALTLSNLEGEETFDASMLGYAEEVAQERVCDDELIVITKPKVCISSFTPSCIILLSGPKRCLDHSARSQLLYAR
jgi:T-complex protein 1 subunit alpha